MKDKTTTIYKNAILNKATDVLQIFIKYIIVIISMLFLGFIFLQSFFARQRKQESIQLWIPAETPILQRNPGILNG